MIDFKKFKRPVAAQFQELVNNGQLFRVSVTKEQLWNTYLDSYPAWTNVIYRKQREYDCSCCRHFIATMGAVVGIKNNELISIWDAQCEDVVYQTVANALSKLVKSAPIDNIFLHTEHTAGVDKNYERGFGATEAEVLTWNHFHVTLPTDIVMMGKNIGPTLADNRGDHDVLKRGLDEITVASLNEVLDLISQNSLYRGAEHLRNLELFLHLKRQYDELGYTQDNFVWYHTGAAPKSVSRLRNTSIGTLLIDLSGGMDVEDAVKKFEKMVAPENYKRPTALVTPRMIADAKYTLSELGLLPSLNRRYAHLNDVSAANVIFADRSIARALQGSDVFDTLTTRATPQTFKGVVPVTLADFITNIVPRAETLEVYFNNEHATRLVSLITAEDATTPHLFKWPNHFSWSYVGDFADSIKERVKQAGGSVTGDLCCRLSWSNHDDLDFHMLEPAGKYGMGYEIYFGNKGRLSPSSGVLDVDMNAGIGTTRTPVENIFYKDRRLMNEGQYRLYVRQFQERESMDVGFTVEIDYLGDLRTFHYPQVMRRGQDVVVALLDYSHAKGLQYTHSLPHVSRKRTVWGLSTEEFHRVNLICQSPNYWHNKTGNLHYFFMLEGCRNEGQARGFYNEFLTTDLNKHRKVIELVGAKMRTEEDTEQLSGLGFSSTQEGELIIRVTGALSRTLKVVF